MLNSTWLNSLYENVELTSEDYLINVVTQRAFMRQTEVRGQLFPIDMRINSETTVMRLNGGTGGETVLKMQNSRSVVSPFCRFILRVLKWLCFRYGFICYPFRGMESF